MVALDPVDESEPLQPLPLYVEIDPQRAAVGELLFHDATLSADGAVSCASCHPLDKGAADGLAHSRGSGGKLTALNTLTIFNVAFNFRYNWNGAYATLEEEFDAPLTRSMGTDILGVQQKLLGQPEYVRRFAAAYSDGITPDNIRNSLAEYLKSLITPNARFDRYLRGDEAAISDDEKAGYRLFKEHGCASCHQGVNVGGNMFQRMGVMRNYFADREPSQKPTTAELGRYNVTALEADRHVFRVPSLRNVDRTAPYFHDGSAGTLEQAITLMAHYQLGRSLNPRDVSLIAAFLRTLTGELKGKPL